MRTPGLRGSPRLGITDMNGRATVKLAAAIALALVAAGFAASRLTQFGHTGEEKSAVWFYSQKSGRLYPVSKDTVPPDDKRDASGVRAVVVCFDGQKDRTLRVAYLQTCGPALKTALDQVQAARASSRAPSAQPPPRESDFYQTNNLVKRLDDSQWYPADSPEGRKIMGEWRSWRGPEGQASRICLP